MKNKLSIIGLVILYVIYRIAMVPYFNDTIMTFNYFVKFSTNRDYFKTTLSVIILTIMFIFGIINTIFIVLGVLLLNFVVFLIWKKWRRKV